MNKILAATFIFLSMLQISAQAPTDTPPLDDVLTPIHSGHVQAGASVVNVRECPSTDCQIVGKMQNGASVQVYAIDQDAKNEDWYLVGESQWIWAQLIKIVDPNEKWTCEDEEIHISFSPGSIDSPHPRCAIATIDEDFDGVVLGYEAVGRTVHRSSYTSYTANEGFHFVAVYAGFQCVTENRSCRISMSDFLLIDQINNVTIERQYEHNANLESYLSLMPGTVGWEWSIYLVREDADELLFVYDGSWGSDLVAFRVLPVENSEVPG